MPDGFAEIALLAVIESQLRSEHGPIFKNAVHVAYNRFGPDVERIAEIAGLPMFTVQRALLADGINRTTDD
jgi:hypothetical protein